MVKSQTSLLGSLKNKHHLSKPVFRPLLPVSFKWIFTKQWNKKLSNDEREFCEKTINESEILKSIKNLSNGKTRGSDGLSTNFYKCFWIDIKNLLTQSMICLMGNYR